MFLVPSDHMIPVVEDDDAGGIDSLVRTFTSLLAAMLSLLWIAFREEVPPLHDLDSRYDWSH